MIKNKKLFIALVLLSVSVSSQTFDDLKSKGFDIEIGTYRIYPYRLY